MSQPSVDYSEVDGALGVLPAGSRLLAVVGISSLGTAAAPTTLAKVKDISTTFGIGPMPEAAALLPEVYQRPVLCLRAAQAGAGTCGAVAHTGAGTSVVSVSVATSADDYEFGWYCVTGGTIGVAGITFQYSLDGGRTKSPVMALGIPNTFTFPNSGGVTISFAPGTVLANQKEEFRGTAPTFDGTSLGAALDALNLSQQPWEGVLIAGTVDATIFDLIETKMAAAQAKGKEVYWIGNTRMTNAAESEAAYKTSLDTIFATKATTVGELCAGEGELISALSGRAYRRPYAFALAPFENSLTEEANAAEVGLGGLKGFSIRDAGGNPKYHDESANPGLDDSRFSVARTWEDFAGVYPNRPRIFSSAGSDFQLSPHRRVMNLAKRTLRAYLQLRTSKPVLVNASTGFILESEAAEIEATCNALLEAELLSKPKASGGGFQPGNKFFQLSRTDNLLSTKRMTCTVRIVPLAYPEFISVDWGFYNPALAAVTV
jgi:hypothetical protein